MKDHLVAALAYDGLCTFEFGCVVEMFSLARPELGIDWYRFAVCSAERGPLRAAGGIQVVAPYGLQMLARADTIIVPGWRNADETPPEPLLRALRRAHARGARLASICSGVFVLAAAGVLDGRAATTHWRYASKLHERFPSIEVKTQALYVDEGQVVTAAGSAAGLDMLLHLVRRDHGAKVANRVAQRLVIPPHRLGDQAQFVPRPMRVDEAARLSRLMDWVRAHTPHPHKPATQAGRAGKRGRKQPPQFQESVGLTPVEWITRERVCAARELLESSRRPIADIAERTGFGSEESFRRHFRLITGVSPATYRRQFATATAT